MAPEHKENTDSSEGEIEAVLFEAISHPTRIKILFSLERESFGFADLKRKTGISSSGNLQHHISKLATLVGLDSCGKYTLSDQGHDALVTIRSLRHVQNHQNQQNRETIDKKFVTFGASLSYYVVQMNMPFFYGNIDLLTPLYALVSSFVFALIFYPISGYMEKRRAKRD